jgi:high-affinity iron transporter
MSALRAAYEAGWLTAGQQTWLDLSAIARPGSVQESLLTGMLGIRSNLPVVEIVAYLLYAVPMLLVVLWPPRRTPSRQTLGRILVGTGAASVVVALVLAALTPAPAERITGSQGPIDVRGTTTASLDVVTGQSGAGSAVSGSVEVTLTGDATAAGLTAISGTPATTVSGTSTLTTTGHQELSAGSESGSATVSATVLSGSPISAPVDAAAAGLPTTLTAAELSVLNGGRLPVGLRSGQAGQSFDVRYVDGLTPELRVDAATGVVLGVQVRWLRTIRVTVPDRGEVAAGTVSDATMTATANAAAAGVATVAGIAADNNLHQVLGEVIPGLLLVFAAVLLAFGLPKLRRPRQVRSDPAAKPGPAPDLVKVAPTGRPGG